MAESDSYSYDGLDQKFVKKAEKELGEKPAQVLAHIASLRRWVKSMRHLTCRTDDRFLLRFLRTAKFDQSRAQMMLDNYVTIRKSPKGSPQWFIHPSIDGPVVAEYLSNPFHVFLGHTSEGEGVYMASMRFWNPEKIAFDDLVRCIYMSVDFAQCDQLSQISGVKIMLNMDQVDRRQLNFFENRKNLFTLMRNWQDAFPLRIRSIVYINEPAFFDVFFTLFKNAPFLKEKFKQKLHKVGRDYAKLRKILGPADAQRLLPKELGGDNGTVQDHLQTTRNYFHSEAMHREWRLVDEMAVDESQRMPDTKNYLKNVDDSVDAAGGISGTFTRLNVD